MIDDIVKECPDDSPSALWDRIKLAIKCRTQEYISCSKVHLKEYRQLSSELEDLQGILDEWIDLEGPTEELATEIAQKTDELLKLKETITQPQKTQNIVRSQVFEDTCSKYFFKKVTGIAGSLRQVFDQCDHLVSSDADILQQCFAFYVDLYAQANSPTCQLSNYTMPPPQRTLTQEQCEALAAPITKDDVEYSLCHMNKNKSPGCDGLTTTFYLRFWPVIGDLVFDSIAYAQEVRMFTSFQRMGVLKLLPKPCKDPRFITNLRPITLLNLDYKLFTKTLADRVKVVLPMLLHADQNGFVKGRFMGNNILDIYALMAMAEELDTDDMVLLSLDIHKAFDSVQWDFLKVVLWGFGFPVEFLDWVSLTQQNAQVQILNNGHWSESISIKCGLPQGCGLSPFLFILAVEGLANTKRADDRIPGITIGGTCKKVAQVADDTLLSFFGSRAVAQRVKCVLEHFSQLSGLKLNYEKSSLIALGKNVPNWFADDSVKDIKKKHISEGFSYLRLDIGKGRLGENFPVEPNLVNRLLDTRVHHRTGLSGRILQMKQLVASTFVYRFQLIPSPTVTFMRTIDSQLHNYVWEHSRHRMCKELLWQPTSQGGLGMINIFIQNKALKFAWFNRLLSDTANVQFWTAHLSHCFILPLSDVLNCNIHYQELDVLLQQKLPCFWADVFTQWFKQFFISPGCTTDEDKTRVLSLPVVFNSEMAVGTGWIHPQLHELLQEQGVLLLKPFLLHFPTVFAMMNIVDPITAIFIAQL